ncbi:response regulator transcription factor [Candidatus Microgenomates bacterium]|nr:response regulator transcription factor [Candidatus Microgenomates bacterium]
MALEARTTSLESESRQSSPLVLVISNEVPILGRIRRGLKLYDLNVSCAYLSEESIESYIHIDPGSNVSDAVYREHPDLVLLALNSGGAARSTMIDIQKGNSVPTIILLPGKPRLVDIIASLEQGADHCEGRDYLDFEELSIRVRSVIKRWQEHWGFPEPEPVIRAGNVEIDLGHSTVKKNGQLVPLSLNEWSLLRLLAQNSGRVLINGEILIKIWGPEYRDDSQYLRQWINKLRSKIEDNPKHPAIIITRIGIGYMLVDNEFSLRLANQGKKTEDKTA